VTRTVKGSIPLHHPKFMKCKKHPKYKGLRKPRLLNYVRKQLPPDFMEAAEDGCTCWGVCRRVQYVRKGDTIRIQGYAKGNNGKLAKVLWTDGDYVMVKRLDTKVKIDLLRVECKKVFKRP
jgi:hypothetical protein